MRKPDRASRQAARDPLIRQQLHWHANPQYRFAPHPEVMNDPAWRRGLLHLAEHSLLFEIQLFTSQMRHGAELARAFPDVTFVLEHAGIEADQRCEWDVDAWSFSGSNH